MDPITLGLLGAGLGMAKTGLVDAPNARRQRELQAKTALYSPWTNLKPENVHSPDALGSALQGGVSFYQMGQKADAEKAAQEGLAEDRALKREELGIERQKLSGWSPSPGSYSQNRYTLGMPKY